MTNLPIRYSPSGTPITNDTGGVLQFGPGARLRLTEGQVIMGGSQAIPVEADVIGPDGFGAPDATVLTLSAPKAGLQYRAKLSLDVVNTSTNASAEVALYLDTSVDGGATYINRAKSVHIIGADTVQREARNMDVYLPLILGTSLGVDDSATTTIKLRARASMPDGPVGASVRVSSLGTSLGGTPVTGCNGTIHIELEECL
jgi:hypothetical protein